MKARLRERLWLALLLAAATALFEAAAPLDLWISAAFHRAGPGGVAFPANQWWPVHAMYVAVPWLGMALFAGALLLCLRAHWRPAAVSVRARRRALALLLCALLGVGGVVHALLKDGWGRPRPDQTTAFGGAQPFMPALHRSTLCGRNCSFVSGHAAAGFALIALGVFGTPRTRLRWRSVGMVAGLVIGLGRVAQGRHYASDIVFGLIVVWACVLLLREAWLRARLWRRSRRRRARPPPRLSWS